MTDSVTWDLNTTSKGHLSVNKIGIYAGDDEYEDVQGIKFKLYVMSGNNKKYVKINGSSSITNGAVTVTSQSNNESSSKATVFTTPASGTVDINNIALGKYYIEETSESNQYRRDIYEAKVKIGSSDDSKFDNSWTNRSKN